MKVGYQGNHGTFSEIATLRYFKGQDIEQRGYRNFPSILKDVEDSVLDYGMIPIENTTTGIIARSYDLFRKYDIHICGEINVEIRQDFIVVPGTDIKEVKEVYSHPEALSQCSHFFEAHDWMKPCAYQDTAESVAYIKKSNDHTKAAIGSYRAAEYYEMGSMETGIQDSTTNMTRFVVVSHREEVSEDANKISLQLILKHRPGSLYNILGILSKNGINIVRLESRPIPGKIFQYMFYVDIEGNIHSKDVKEALHEMELRCEECKIFGCYKSDETKM